MSAVLSKDNVIELLERAVEEKGADYVDPNSRNGNGCQYADENGAPLCIVGHVFSYLGEPLQATENDWDELVPWNADTDAASLIDDEDFEVVDVLDRDVVASVLYAAQVQQDGKHTWGEALEAAKNRLAEGDRD